MSAAQFPLQPFKKQPYYEGTKPLLRVNIDGTSYLPKSYSLTTNAHGATDSAEVVLPITGNPDWTQQIARSDELGNANKPVPIEIFLDLNSTGVYMSRFVGIVDQYSADGARDVVTFACRSMAAPLTSNKIWASFTAGSAITTVSFIQQQAQRFGLDTNIVLAPGQQPGKMTDVLGADLVTGVRNWNLWALMQQCAQYDDVDLWVDRHGTLNYAAASIITRNPITYTWGKDILNLVGTHSPQFSRNVQVELHSYTKRTRQSVISRSQSLPGGGMQTTNFTRTVTGAPTPFGSNEYTTTSYSSNGSVTVTRTSVEGGSDSSGPTKFAAESGIERYVLPVASKKPQDLDDLSQRMWRQISQHEYSIRLTVPMTQRALAIMDVTADIKIEGFSLSAFNQTGKQGYWPREITETADTEAGAIWIIDAVNHVLPQGAV